MGLLSTDIVPGYEDAVGAVKRPERNGEPEGRARKWIWVGRGEE